MPEITEDGRQAPVVGVSVAVMLGVMSTLSIACSVWGAISACNFVLAGSVVIHEPKLPRRVPPTTVEAIAEQLHGGRATMNVQYLLDAFPSVRIDNDNAPYYQGLLEQRLLVNRCDECRHWHHPPRPICPRCWSNLVTATDVAGSGFVALVTVLRQGRPEPGVDYEHGHVLAAVELDEQPGLRIASTVIGADATEISVGQRVRLVWRSIEGRSPRPDFEVVR